MAARKGIIVHLGGVYVGRTKQYEEWQLIHWLKDFAEELGRSPTQLEVDNEPSMPSANTYKSRISSKWNKVLRKAGLEINRVHEYQSKKELLEKLKEVCDELGRAPKPKEMPVLNLPSRYTYKNYFGSCEAALQKIGYEKNKKDWTKEEMLEALKKYAQELGRTPTSREVNQHPDLPATSTYYKYFGPFSEVCKKAGLVPFERGTNLEHISEEEYEKRVVN